MRPPALLALLAGSVLMLAGCAAEPGADEGVAPSAPAASPAPPAPTAPAVDSVPEAPGAGVLVGSVVDGDTIDVFVDRVPERVRLIGIDTPEAGECLAEEAAARLAELVSTGEVRLVPDRSERDQYGRLLRYVDLDDGRSANAVLVAEGLALARSYPPDTARDDELDEAQRSARADGIGLWAGDSCGAPSAAAVEVVGFNADPPGDDSLVLEEEWVVVRNTGTETVDLTGWGLRDESASKRYSFPDGFRLDGGREVTIRSGCGDDTERDLHWCVSGSAIWNNTGDTAFLLDPTGNIHHSLGY